MSASKERGVLKAIKQVRGGVPAPHYKNTAAMRPERMPAPERVVLAMQQHIGVPCKPTVKVGETVAVGQIIGDSDAFISVPIHASVSGKVSGIGELTLPNGVISQSVTIESDGEMRMFEGLDVPKIENKQDFLAAVRASGLVGLGGAGFPTHAKLNWPDSKAVDTLIVNAAECEPYITVDYRECLDNAWYIISGVVTLKEMLGINRVIIAVEDNKPEAIRLLRYTCRQHFNLDDSVQLMQLKSKYPQGAEKMIVQSATGRKIPPGKLPGDVGCLVVNVGSIAFLARYLETGKPLVSRSLTVDGSAIEQPKNVRVPIGTNIGTIIDFCGGFRHEPDMLVTGGPMMGLTIVGTDLPTLKQNNAILALAKNPQHNKRERDCIRCGRCAQTCPLQLQPTLIQRFAKAQDAAHLKRIGVEVCMECGSCAYSCPAGLPLVQYMRLAKSVVREAQQAKK